MTKSLIRCSSLDPACNGPDWVMFTFQYEKHEPIVDRLSVVMGLFDKGIKVLLH